MTVPYPIHVVDDDASLRNSLRFMLGNNGRLVRTFDCGEALLAELDRLEPGPVLLDVRLAGMDGLDVQSEMTRRGSRLPVVILTGHGDIAMAVRAMKGGAVDFLTKPFARSDLLAVLEQADARLLGIDALEEHRARAMKRLEVLTRREFQVLNELARGLPNKSIAYDLSISPRTVEVHRANVMRKLGVTTFPDALRIAFAAGMPFPLPLNGGDASEPALPLADDNEEFHPVARDETHSGRNEELQPGNNALWRDTP